MNRIENMKIELTNIGKIKNSLVELNGITIIAGYNSTGKSTISKALVGLLNAYSDLPGKIKQQRFGSVRRALCRELDEAAETPYFHFYNRKEIDELVEKIINIKDYELTKENLTVSLEHMDEQGKEGILKNYDKIKDAVTKYRYLSDEEYVRFIVSNKLQDYFNQQISSFDHEDVGWMELTWSSKESVTVQIERNIVKNCSYNFLQEAQPIYIEPRHVLDDLENRVFQSELENKLKDEKHGRDEGISLAEYEYDVQIQNIIEDLKKDITHGFLRKRENSLTFCDVDFEHDVDVRNVASGIKSMALILRLLENGNLKPGGILVIDEPEVNLHPQWQLSFAEFLVLLNKKLKVQILLNTHSPFFLRAIEVYTEKYETKKDLRLYLTQLCDEKLYTTIDVTDKSEEIYRQLYMPLEGL